MRERQNKNASATPYTNNKIVYVLCGSTPMVSQQQTTMLYTLITKRTSYIYLTEITNSTYITHAIFF